VETPDETALAALLTAVLRGYAEEQRLAYSLLATKDSILELVRYATGSEPTPREQVALLNGWRGRTVGELLEDILTGKRMVRVTGRDGRRALEVTRPN
jgi:ribonuclease D